MSARALPCASRGLPPLTPVGHCGPRRASGLVRGQGTGASAMEAITPAGALIGNRPCQKTRRHERESLCDVAHSVDIHFAVWTLKSRAGGDAFPDEQGLPAPAMTNVASGQIIAHRDRKENELQPLDVT